MGAWCHCVLTTLTAQSPRTIHGLMPIETRFVLQQLNAVFEEKQFSPQALKTGMLGRSNLIAELANNLSARNLPLVIDTVFESTSGCRLADSGIPALVAELLFPLASVITPNLKEAALLLECEEAKTLEEMKLQAKKLYQLGPQAVLLTGGHLQGLEAIDLLFTKNGTELFSAPKIDTSHTHGSGCCLSTAIAVGLAQKLSLTAAIEQAKLKTTQFIKNASQANFVNKNGPLVHYPA